MAEPFLQPLSRKKHIPLEVWYEQEEPVVMTPNLEGSIQHDLECDDPGVETLARDNSFPKSTRMESRYPSTIYGDKPLPYTPLIGVSRTPSGRF